MQWLFPEFKKLTEEIWENGFIKAMIAPVILARNEKMEWNGYGVYLVRHTKRHKYPLMNSQVIFEKTFETKEEARYQLQQEAIKRRYPKPSEVIFDENWEL